MESHNTWIGKYRKNLQIFKSYVSLQQIEILHKFWSCAKSEVVNSSLNFITIGFSINMSDKNDFLANAIS
jgi:hypothetical protein